MTVLPKVFSQRTTNMETVMFALVSMLISQCAAIPPHPNLNRIIDLAEKYNKILTERYFVEDVTDLADAGCGNNFFCKVHDILKTHAKNDKETEIVRNLEIFITKSDMKCKEELKNIRETKTEKPLPDLLDNLKNCIQKRNFIINRRQNA